MSKHILELFLPSGSCSILVFPYKTLERNSNGVPLNGVLNVRWGVKNCEFLAVSRFISEMIPDIAIVTEEHQLELVWSLLTVSDRNLDFKVTIFFKITTRN